jgi:hypothetical protein
MREKSDFPLWKKMLIALYLRLVDLVSSWIELAFIDGLCAILIYFLYDYIAVHVGIVRLTYLEVAFSLYGLDLAIRTIK